MTGNYFLSLTYANKSEATCRDWCEAFFDHFGTWELKYGDALAMLEANLACWAAE